MWSFRPAAIFILMTSIAASAEPEAVDAAKRKFGIKMTELSVNYFKDLRDAKAEYLAKLEDVLRVETQKGDLDRVLTVKSEKARVEGDKPAEKGIPPHMLQPARGVFDGKLVAARGNYERAAKAAHAAYLADLDGVVRDETKAGRLDGAIAVREFRKKLEKEVPSGAPPDPKPEPKEPVAVTPTPAPTPPPVTSVIPPPTVPTPKPPPTPAPAVAVQTKPGVFTWANAKNDPAKIQVEKLPAARLDPKGRTDDAGGFQTVPEKFAGTPVTYYGGGAKQSFQPVAEIAVLEDGFLFVWCNYNYQGNSGGGWEKERWTARDFVQNGWQHLTEKDMGGLLVKGKPGDKNVGPTEVFVKYVRKGESLKLRCNKYHPPLPFVFGEVK